MYYEINISKNGHHFFATAERSLTNYDDMKRALAVFVEKFPKSEGYEILVTQWERKGKQLDLVALIKED